MSHAELKKHAKQMEQEHGEDSLTNKIKILLNEPVSAQPLSSSKKMDSDRHSRESVLRPASGVDFDNYPSLQKNAMVGTSVGGGSATVRR